jgi:hypothetical protein
MAGTTVRQARDVRGWGLACAVGALCFLAASTVGTLASGTAAEVGWELFSAVGTALLLAGVVGVARSGATGRGWLGRTGLVATAAGCVVVVLGFTIDAVVGLEPVALYAVGTGLLFLGPVLAGIAVVRARVWSGPWRWSLLSAGLVLLVVAWFFDDDGILGAVAGGLWMLCWLWVAAALLRARA